MTNKEFEKTLKAMKLAQKKTIASKAKAMATLKRAGIVDKNGEVKKPYRQVIKDAA